MSKNPRKKTNDEPIISTRMKRDQHTMRCKKCDVSGHNQRTCKGNTTSNMMIPRDGNKVI